MSDKKFIVAYDTICTGWGCVQGENEEPVSVSDQMRPSRVAEYVNENTVGENATTAQLPSNGGLEAVFTKDYSALMKAMDNKQSFRP